VRSVDPARFKPARQPNRLLWAAFLEIPDGCG
jgi:hypothetical protein